MWRGGRRGGKVAKKAGGVVSTLLASTHAAAGRPGRHRCLTPRALPVQIWSDGQCEAAISRLSAFARYEATGTPFAAKPWRRLGSWRREMAKSEPYSLSRAAQTLDCFSRAIAEAPDNYKACHAWAMVHFEAVQQLPWAEAVQFVAPAVSHRRAMAGRHPCPLAPPQSPHRAGAPPHPRTDPRLLPVCGPRPRRRAAGPAPAADALVSVRGPARRRSGGAGRVRLDLGRLVAARHSADHRPHPLAEYGRPRFGQPAARAGGAVSPPGGARPSPRTPPRRPGTDLHAPRLTAFTTCPPPSSSPPRYSVPGLTSASGCLCVRRIA
jgi:hypothetical protein